MAEGADRGVPLEEAIATASSLAPAVAEELVALAELTGRILSRPVRARSPIPAFTHSAMDGFAVRSADTPGELRRAGESAAGDAPGALGPGEAWRISTGAPLPEGADAVVRQEEVDASEASVRVRVRTDAGADVRRAGEDAPEGAPVLVPGATVAPHEVGVVAAAGHDAAWCRARPRVAILATGRELAPPGAPLPAGAVYDSNRHGVAAQVEAAGGAVVAVARVGDDGPRTEVAIRRLLGGDAAPPDILVTLGGLSVGPHDHVRAALAAAGVEEVVPGLGTRPGQPTRIGARGRQVVLSLPGNPVSAMVCLHVLGRPLLGCGDPFTLRLPLARGIVHGRRQAGLLRCRLSDAGLDPIARQGSADVGSLGGARAIAWIPAGADRVADGTRVRASPLW